MNKGAPSPPDPLETIPALILTIRNRPVILDADLAQLYEVPVKRLNEQVKRNSGKFPEDFAFRISSVEWDFLRSQNATLKPSDANLRANFMTPCPFLDAESPQRRVRGPGLPRRPRIAPPL